MSVVDDPELAERVMALHAALAERGLTVAAAESLTAGLLLAVLTEPAGASAAIRGGVVVYATDLKATLADVPADLLAEDGPVSPRVAAALASGVRSRLGAGIGVALTGVAGPEPQGGAEVGTVYGAVALQHDVTVQRAQIPGDRRAVREGAVRMAVEMLASATGSGAGSGTASITP